MHSEKGMAGEKERSVEMFTIVRVGGLQWGYTKSAQQFALLFIVRAHEVAASRHQLNFGKR